MEKLLKENCEVGDNNEVLYKSTLQKKVKKNG